MTLYNDDMLSTWCCNNLVDCGIPMLGQNVVIDLKSYSTTTENSTIMFHCSEGFSPNNTVMSECTNEGNWNPNPNMHMCTQYAIAVNSGGHDQILSY